MYLPSNIELWSGTPNYIAPEILREDPFNEKIDNFALGSILYYMFLYTYVGFREICHSIVPR
jgi:serine/threonine protein kinase